MATVGGEQPRAAQGGPSRRLRINWIEARANLSGGQRSNLLIAEAMARRGHDARIYFVAHHPWPPLRRIRVFARRAREELRNVGRPRHHFHSASVRCEPVRAAVIRPEDVADADVSIATWWETAEWIAAWPASKGSHAYFVRGYEIHGGDPERVRATYRLPMLKLVTSSYLRDLMRDEFGDASAVLVPNGADRDPFDAPARAKGAVPSVGFLYSHKKVKRMDVACEALRRVQREEPALRIQAFGTSPPPPEQRLRNMSFALRPSPGRIAEIYRRCDCWLIASDTEGFGMPGLEAAACRCPVVSTRCGGPADYVRDGASGYLVPVGDAGALAARVLAVLRAPPAEWQRMSEASYALARGFDWDRSAEVLEAALLAHLAR